MERNLKTALRQGGLFFGIVVTLVSAIFKLYMKSIISALQWRAAVKKFDADKKLSAEQIDELLEAMRLAPSSYGLQPWRFVIVNDSALRTALRAASWDQAQITDASHLIVLVAKTPDDALADEYVAEAAAQRDVAVEALGGLSRMIKGALSSMDDAARLVWAQKQVYIALGIGLETAALMGIDTCPIEGFDADAYDELLGLREQGLHATVVLAAGFRALGDDYSSQKKVRFPKETIVIEK